MLNFLIIEDILPKLMRLTEYITMNKIFKNSYRIMLSVLVLLFLNACETTESVVQTGPAAEVTFDGLHRVDGTGKVQAWVKPSVSLAKYTKILPVQTGVQYRRVHSNRINDTEFELNNKQKKRLEKILQDSFADELQKSQYFTLTDKPGPDVVILKAGLIDVVSNVPEESVGFKEVYIKTIGSATLVIELQDSISEEMLVRATERRTSESSGDDFHRSNPVTNFSKIKRDARRWAKSLREALDELHELK